MDEPLRPYNPAWCHPAVPCRRCEGCSPGPLQRWACPHLELIPEPDDGPRGICVNCGGVIQRYLTRDMLDEALRQIGGR